MAKGATNVKAGGKAKAKAKAGGGGGAITLVVAGLTAGVLLSYALPTAVLLGLGLIPSAVAYAFDPVPGRPGARAVFFLNLAAMAPTLADFWRGGGGLGGSLALLADWRTLGLAWAGALAGWGLKAVLPMLAGLSVDAEVRAHRTRLETRRGELSAEWGEP